MTRQLVAYDTGDKRLYGLDPNQASAIPLPAFQYGPVRPAVGGVVGQAFIETSTGIASVWDGNTWTQIAVPVIVPVDTESNLLQKTPNDGTVAFAEDTGNLYTRTNGEWLALGLRIYATRAGLDADTPPDGTMGFAEDTAQYFVRTGGVWANLTQQTVTVGATAPNNPSVGEQWLDPATSTLFTWTGALWAPPQGGIPTGTIITFADWAPPVGYLRCDGAAIPAGTQYDALKALLGGANTPDLKDQFIRMGSAATDILTRHNDTTRRPRSSDFTVTASGNTSTTGNHTHTFDSKMYNTDGGWESANPEIWTNTVGNHWSHRTDGAGNHHHHVSLSGTVNGGGDAETAPVHVKLAYHIKF